MNIYKERIQPLFESSALNDAELEREIGIPPKTICNWKAGRVKSYNKYIAQIAMYFNISIDYLLGKTDDPSPTGQKEKPSGQMTGGLDEEIISRLLRLTPEELQKVDAFVQGLLANRSK